MADNHSDFEARFWGDCTNTYNEETKQLVYMKMMGFEAIRDWRTPWNFDMGGRSVLDIGGGPSSVLLKCFHLGPSMVVDPMKMPNWVKVRYESAGIVFRNDQGEDIWRPGIARFDINLDYDLALIYNCLQHTDDPACVVTNARSLTRDLAMFEWIGIPPHAGHPHELTEEKLNEWAGRPGRVVTLSGNECYGRAWVLQPERT